MPFGAGPAPVPGRYLAILEMKMVMAMLLNNFEIESVGTPDGGEAREHLAFTMYPEDLRLRLKRRRGLELAALDARDDLGELLVARRRHADLGALARDVAVHRVDLGAPAFRMSCAMGTLDVRAGIGAGFGTIRASSSASALRVSVRGARVCSGSAPRIFSSW